MGVQIQYMGVKNTVRVGNSGDGGDFELSPFPLSAHSSGYNSSWSQYGGTIIFHIQFTSYPLKSCWQ